jgi:hypothetical protein
MIWDNGNLCLGIEAVLLTRQHLSMHVTVYPVSSIEMLLSLYKIIEA